MIYIYHIGDFISLIPYLLIRKKAISEIVNNNNLIKNKKKEAKKTVNYIYNDKIKKNSK